MHTKIAIVVYSILFLMGTQYSHQLSKVGSAEEFLLMVWLNGYGDDVADVKATKTGYGATIWWYCGGGEGWIAISAVGPALDVTDKRIIFEASAAAAEIRSGEYLQGFDVGERRPLDWLVHHLFWSRGEGKSTYQSGNPIVTT